MLTYLHRTSDAVLMETIAPVGTAEIGAIDTVYLLAPLLGHHLSPDYANNLGDPSVPHNGCLTRL